MYKGLPVSTNWIEDVYRPTQHHELPDVVRDVVLDRYHYRCAVRACRSTHSLSVHHIIPRSAGGKDIQDNLILLCDDCHDEIEDVGIRTKDDIRNFVPEHLRPEIEEREVIDPNDWHTWVYGSGRRPK